MYKKKLLKAKAYMSKLHSRLILFFVLLVCIIMLIETYRYNSLGELIEKAEDSYTSSEKIVNVREKVDKLKVGFEDYLATKDKDSIVEFKETKRLLENSLGELKVNGKYSEKNIKQVNFYNMVSQYLEIVNSMVENGKNITNSHVLEEEKLYSYIQEYSNEIMGEQLLVDTKEYVKIKEEVASVNIWTRVISMVVLIVAILLIVAFCLYITNPIKKLVDKTKTVAEGNYNLSVYDEDALGEVEELYESFNIMTRSIRDNVGAIKKARMLEQALAKEKIDNLNMRNALKEAEYNALVSQVNPHFIFNTINIGSQLAYLNDDEVTSKYLTDAASLFRYNLNGLSMNVSIDKEIANVESYIAVMETRYGDGIKFSLNISSQIDLNDIMMPKMTLQPLVEFVYINSVNSLEEGGLLKLIVSKYEQFYMIDILSTGKEIEQKTINMVMLEEQVTENNDKTVEEKEYYMSVEGVRNAIRRLKILYERKDVVVIRRDEDINYITIKIPYNEILDMR